MAAIRTLPDDLINAIAAGEVVERPASCAKELVENSLDAQCSWIDLTYRQGGMAEIAVADDGQGIPGAEVLLALERHATSKLADFSDLDQIRSLGFRGEAVPAIAQVSRLELLTRSPSDQTATRVLVDGGRLLLRERVAAALGTTVTVRDLFFNTPARQAHLRSADVEGSRLVQEVSRLALAAPEVGFRVSTDERLVLATDGNGDLRAAAASIWGLEVAEDLVPIFDQYAEVTISGLISRPHRSRSSRAAQVAVVNGRAVNNPRLRYAAEQAYRDHLMRGRFPYLVLCLTLPARSVDPNVHPSKWEVRLRSEDELAAHVYQASRQALGLERRVVAGTELPDPAPFFSHSRGALQAGEQIGLGAMQLASGTAVLGPTPRALCQVRSLFLVAADDQGLYLIDQHAAHERITFEALSKTQSAPSQLLLAPTPVRLLPQEAEQVLALKAELAAVGCEVDALGPSGEVIVRSLPTALAGSDQAASLHDLLVDVAGCASVAEASERARGMRTAMAACRASVKRGESLGSAAQQALIDALWQCTEPRQCPHGRPVWIKLPFGSVEHQLGRS